MRAISQTGFGGPDVLQLVEVDRPRPLPTEVLVRVLAAGVNPVDWKTRADDAFLQLTGPPPYIPGWDVAGVVEAVGPGVTRFAEGDEVLGMPWFPRRAGAYAEYVTAPSRHFARKPAAWSFAEAAGLPLAGLTAWQVLVDVAGTSPGQRVLVNGAAGGVGHLAVQIAKARGAHVIGTARAAKHDFLASLGVDEAVDYTTTEVAAVTRDVDVVFDPIGGKGGLALAGLVRPGGTVVTFGAPPGLAERVRAAGAQARSFLVEPDGYGLERLVALAEAGRLRVEVEAVLPLAEAGKAQALGEQGRTRGKLVLDTTR